MDTYWNNSEYQWLFYTGILFVFFEEKNIWRKMVLCVFPLIAYFLLINPFTLVVATRVWGTEAKAYMCRQFSLVPFFYVIAYAGTMIVNKVSGMKKGLVLVGMSLGIVLFGSRLIYYHEAYGFEKSENAYKIPTDLLLVCDYLSEVDEDPVVAVYTDLSFMVRQYSPSIHLLVGPRAHGLKLSDELMSDNPDVKYIMSTTCALGGDFVVTKNSNSLREAFAKEGYTPCFETEGLLVYENGKYPGVRLTFNDIEQIVKKDYYDDEGEPCLSEEGYASVEFVYDESGSVIEEHYYGVDGKEIEME